MKNKIMLLVFLTILSIFATLTIAKDSSDDGPCIQVITQAYNSQLKACRNFWTPCDVPHNWIIGNCSEIAQNETENNNTNSTNKTSLEIRQCKRECNLIFVNSTKICSRVYADSIHSCNEARNSAFAVCKNMTNSTERRECRKLAINASQICKAEARAIKNECKLNVRTERKSCKIDCE